MAALLRATVAWAGHPAADTATLPAAFAGPKGCWQTTVRVQWDHRAGRWSWSGESSFHARFEAHSWSIVARPTAASSLDAQFVPLMVGLRSRSALRYWVTSKRWFVWPAPVATEPVRTWGEVFSEHQVPQPDGGTVLVHNLYWDHYKRQSAERRLTRDSNGAVTALALVVQERIPRGLLGCRRERRGHAQLGANGLPQRETWTTDQRCGVRAQRQGWRFDFSPWQPCNPP